MPQAGRTKPSLEANGNLMHQDITEKACASNSFSQASDMFVTSSALNDKGKETIKPLESNQTRASGKELPISSMLSPTPMYQHGEKHSTSRKTMARISRMFSQTSRDYKRDPRREERESSSDTDANLSTRTQTSNYHSMLTFHPQDISQMQHSLLPQSDGRKASQTSTASSTPGIEAFRKEPALLQRFVRNDDGTHQHYLRSTKRQEKLSNMLRDLLGGKKRDEASSAEMEQLSLIHSFADQIKKEKDSMKDKTGISSTATLVEKYGKCQEIIGRGAFGIVRISHKVDTKSGMPEQLYAVKEFRRRPQESAKKYTKRLTSEFCISSSLRHANVIHTLDLLQDAKGDYCEVMEFCAGGDLYTLILTAGKLDNTEADCYFKQLMKGVEYMHEMGVAHRDLKPENLLLTTNGALKITDFGNGECFRMAWEKEAHMTCGLCGSAPYIAPEEYTDKEFDPRAVDVWATGVIYMAMRTGRHLWRIAQRENDEFYERYLEGRRDEAGYEPIEALSRSRCRNVIYSILDPNPTRRITAKQVLNSEWGREIQVCKAGESGI